MAHKAKRNSRIAQQTVDACLTNAGYSHAGRSAKIPGTVQTPAKLWTSPNGEELLVLVRSQAGPGTAAQKVAFFILGIWDLFRKSSAISRAYIVLCGRGWKIGKFLSSVAKRIGKNRLLVVSFRHFESKAKLGKL